MTTTLPDSIAGRVERLCAEGDDFVTQSRYAAAVMRYATAFRVLPRPAEQWNVTPRILASMTDACFAKSDFIGAREAALAALDCPDVGSNPALQFKLGQIAFEQGDLSEARRRFASALLNGGSTVFFEEDPKYWAFIAGDSAPGE